MRKINYKILESIDIRFYSAILIKSYINICEPAGIKGVTITIRVEFSDRKINL